jgi:hypothetical protein
MATQLRSARRVEFYIDSAVTRYRVKDEQILATTVLDDKKEEEDQCSPVIVMTQTTEALHVGAPWTSIEEDDEEEEEILKEHCVHSPRAGAPSAYVKFLLDDCIFTVAAAMTIKNCLMRFALGQRLLARRVRRERREPVRWLLRSRLEEHAHLLREEEERRCVQNPGVFFDRLVVRSSKFSIDLTALFSARDDKNDDGNDVRQQRSNAKAVTDARRRAHRRRHSQERKDRAKAVALQAAKTSSFGPRDTRAAGARARLPPTRLASSGETRIIDTLPNFEVQAPEL